MRRGKRIAKWINKMSDNHTHSEWIDLIGMHHIDKDLKYSLHPKMSDTDLFAQSLMRNYNQYCRIYEYTYRQKLDSNCLGRLCVVVELYNLSLLYKGTWIAKID
jgi:hypothetical protein